MPEGLSDGGDDSIGGQGGKSFSTEALGEHWAVLSKLLLRRPYSGVKDAGG